MALFSLPNEKKKQKRCGRVLEDGTRVSEAALLGSVCCCRETEEAEAEIRIGKAFVETGNGIGFADVVELAEFTVNGTEEDFVVGKRPNGVDGMSAKCTGRPIVVWNRNEVSVPQKIIGGTENNVAFGK
jgi:hypothetical protein